MNKRRKIGAISIFSIVFVIGIVFIFTYTSSYKSLAPNKQYQASYNRYSRIITIKNIADDRKCYLSDYENPGFLWSKNSRFLAINFTNSSRRASDIIDLEQSLCCTIPDKLAIQALDSKLKTSDNSLNNTCIEVTKWLDNEHVVIEFSWPADEIGYNISGWFIYNIQSSSIKELNFIREKNIPN